MGLGQERAGRWVEKVYSLNREIHIPGVSKVNYQQHVAFHVYFSRQSFENCPSLLLAALLPHIASHLRSTGNTGTRNIRGHTIQSHPLESLFCTFFVQRTVLFKPLRFRSSCHSASREAHGKELKPFKGPATPGSSIFLAPFMHTSLQLSSAQSFQGSSLIQQWATPLPSCCLSQLDKRKGKTYQKRQTDPAPSLQQQERDIWNISGGNIRWYFRGAGCIKMQLSLCPCPLPIHKNSQKRMEVKRRPRQQLNWGLNAVFQLLQLHYLHPGKIFFKFSASIWRCC